MSSSSPSQSARRRTGPRRRDDRQHAPPSTRIAAATSRIGKSMDGEPQELVSNGGRRAPIRPVERTAPHLLVHGPPCVRHGRSWSATRVATVPPCPSSPRSRRSGDSSRPGSRDVASCAAWAFPHPKFDEALLTRRRHRHRCGPPRQVPHRPARRRSRADHAPRDDGRDGLRRRAARRRRPGTRRPVRAGPVPARRRRHPRAPRRPPLRSGRGRRGRATTTGCPRSPRSVPSRSSDDFTPEHLWRALAPRAAARSRPSSCPSEWWPVSATSTPTRRCGGPR